MGSRQPLLVRYTSAPSGHERSSRSLSANFCYLIFDNIFEFGKLAERQRQQAVTLHAVSALRGWFDSSTSHHYVQVAQLADAQS